MSGSLFGIDVSHHQGNIDWFRVASGAAKFAFAKATEGSTFVDPKFARNWQAIREVGLFRGAYHFARPGGDPESQAEHFRAVVGELGFRDLPPVLDLETSDGHSKERVLTWAQTFIERAEALFERPLIVYTGGFWLSTLGNTNLPFFGSRKLWLAAYRKQPVVPASWNDWTLWQYSDGMINGGVSVSGIPAPVDQNRFEGTEADLDALCSEVAPPHPPAPELDAHGFPGFAFVWPRQPPTSGVNVKAFQERLAALGFTLDADGVYGPQSKAACLSFQKERGLVADGIVGRKTWAAAFAG